MFFVYVRRFLSNPAVFGNENNRTDGDAFLHTTKACGDELMTHQEQFLTKVENRASDRPRGRCFPRIKNDDGGIASGHNVVRRGG